MLVEVINPMILLGFYTLLEVCTCTKGILLTIAMIWDVYFCMDGKWRKVDLRFVVGVKWTQVPLKPWSYLHTALTVSVRFGVAWRVDRILYCTIRIMVRYTSRNYISHCRRTIHVEILIRSGKNAVRWWRSKLDPYSQKQSLSDFNNIVWSTPLNHKRNPNFKFGKQFTA